MSRSFKKNAIWTDVGVGKKKYSHRVARTEVRKVLTSNKDYDEMLFPTPKVKELVNQWDVCDHRWFSEWVNKPRIYFHYKTGEMSIEYPTKADFRMYKNK